LPATPLSWPCASRLMLRTLGSSNSGRSKACSCRDNGNARRGKYRTLPLSSAAIQRFSGVATCQFARSRVSTWLSISLYSTWPERLPQGQLGVKLLQRIDIEAVQVLHALHGGLRAGDGGERRHSSQQRGSADRPRIG